MGDGGAELKDEPISSTTALCALQGDFVVVELAEVFFHKGAWKLRSVKERKDFKQYINLDAEVDPDNPHPEYGRCILLKARIEAKPGSKEKSLAGKVVWWHSKSKTNGKDLTHDEKEGFGSEGSGEDISAAKTDAAGWTTLVKFYLSQYGGDSFEIFVSTSPILSCVDQQSGPYVVWRRLFYDIAEMETADRKGKFSMPDAVLPRVKAAYEDVFIELQDTGRRHDGEYASFANEDDGFVWAAKHCSVKGVPFKVHFCVIDHAGVDDAPIESNVVEWADSPRLVGSLSKVSNEPNWLIRQEYLAPNELRPLGAKVTLIGPRHARKFVIDFSEAAVMPTKDAKVKIKLTYLEEMPVFGWSDDDTLHVLVCKGTTEAFNEPGKVLAEIVDTCIHEMGHALGLVPSGAAWRMEEASKGHCKFPTCVMQSGGSATHSERFHGESVSDPGCRTALRRKALDRRAMMKAWNFEKKG